jgi:hypothetical protein
MWAFVSEFKQMAGTSQPKTPNALGGCLVEQWVTCGYLLVHLLTVERLCAGLGTLHTCSGAATPCFVEPVLKKAHVLKHQQKSFSLKEWFII